MKKSTRQRQKENLLWQEQINDNEVFFDSIWVYTNGFGFSSFMLFFFSSICQCLICSCRWFVRIRRVNLDFAALFGNGTKYIWTLNDIHIIYTRPAANVISECKLQCVYKGEVRHGPTHIHAVCDAEPSWRPQECAAHASIQLPIEWNTEWGK